MTEDFLKPHYLNEHGKVVFIHKTDKNRFVERTYHWCDRCITLDESEGRAVVGDNAYIGFDLTDYTLMTQDQYDSVIRNYNEIHDTMKEIRFKFKLRLNIDEFGDYKKGEVDYFHIKLLDKMTGLTRFPIDDHWDILDYEIIE